jgi:hypothetical protein
MTKGTSNIYSPLKLSAGGEYSKLEFVWRDQKLPTEYGSLVVLYTIRYSTLMVLTSNGKQEYLAIGRENLDATMLKSVDSMLLLPYSG